ncbi:MAG TPA: tetratricopeptide repeat protein, partial [Bacteroidota bacterium]
IQESLGQYLEASTSFQHAAAEVQPGDSTLKQESLIALGESSMNLLDYSNALASFERFLRAYPNSGRLATVSLKAGEALEKQKQYAKANTYYLRALRAGNVPDQVRRRAYLYSARNAVALGNYQEAVNLFTEFLERFPAEPSAAEAAYRRAQIYGENLSDYPRAVLAYDRFRSDFPRSEKVDDALFQIARSSEKNGQFNKAVSAYEDFLQHYPASELAGEARQRLEDIVNFELKDKDKGLEKLALLIGDVLSEKSRGKLAFRLAEIYFHDLKDYAAAAQQYTNAINLGVDEVEFIDAYYSRARAFHLLSAKRPALADSALVYYEAFLKLYPTSKWSEEAAYWRYVLMSRSKVPEEAYHLAEQFLSVYGHSKYADEVLNDAVGRSLQTGKAQWAIQQSRRLLAAHPGTNGISQALAQLAAAYMAVGRADSASLLYLQLVKFYPDDEQSASSLFALASLHSDSNRAADAIPLLQTLEKKYFYTSYSERARVALGNAYLDAGRFEEARSQFDSLLTEISENPLARADARLTSLYGLGTAELRLGDRGAAKKHFYEYLRYDRSSKTAGEAYFALGTIARDEGNTELATNFLKRAAALTGEVRAARETAELLFKSGQYQDAKAQYATLAASAKETTDKRYYEFRIIVSNLRSGKVSDAQKEISLFAKAYKDTEPELAEFTYESGLLQFQNKEYASAQKSFERIAKSYDKSSFFPWAQYWLAKILEATQKAPDAKKKFEDMLKKFPASDVIPRVHLALGNIAYTEERYDAAAKHFSYILDNAEAAPDLVYYAMNNLILAYEDAGVYDGALKLTRQFIDRFPNDDSVIDKKVKIGVLYERLGYHDQAIMQLQSLLSVATSDLEAEIRYYIGESYFAKAEYQQAILEFLKVPYLVTKRTRIDWTPNSFYMAGQSYEKMSKFDLAVNMYQQIIDRPGIDPTFKAAAQKEIDRVRSLMKAGTGTKP